MSDRNAIRLERHDRLLMRTYPQAYRADRGEEIIGTLLEATPPGRTWPLAYEVASVIGGGLRARRAANLRQGVSASLRQAAIVGIALYLVQTVPGDAIRAFVEWCSTGFRHFYMPSGQPYLLPSVLIAVILAATWSGRRWLVAVPTVVTFTGTLAYFIVTRDTSAGSASVLLTVIGGLALAALVPLTRRAERPPGSLLWFVGIPLLVTGLEEVVYIWGGPVPYEFVRIAVSQRAFMSPYITYLSLIPVLVAICWLVTDVRPLIGVILAFMLPNTVDVAMHAVRGSVRLLTGSAVLGPTVDQPIWSALILVAIPLALACALVWLLRHRTRTSQRSLS